MHQLGGLALDEERRGGRLQDEREGPILIDGDFGRVDIADLVLSLLIELHAEVLDVETVLAERRTHRRGWIRLAGRDLQFDDCLDCLRHNISLNGLLVS